MSQLEIIEEKKLCVIQKSKRHRDYLSIKKIFIYFFH